MKYTIKWLEELLKDERRIELQTELEVEVPDYAVRVGEAMVFEALGWSDQPACECCGSGEPCVQLVAVQLSHRTARVAHQYDRSATSAPKAWPALRSEEPR